MNRKHLCRWQELSDCPIVFSDGVIKRLGGGKPGKLMLAILAMSPLSGALAADECGSATPGGAIDCTGAVSGEIYYSNVNADLTLNGTTLDGPVNIERITIDSFNVGDTFNASITTVGPVSIASTHDNLLNFTKGTSLGIGSGDASLILGSETQLNLTGDDYGIAVQFNNISYDDFSNSVIDIADGASITVDKNGYVTEGVSIYHYGNGSLRVTQAGSIQVSAESAINGLIVNGGNTSYIENTGQIVLTKKSNDGGYGGAINVYAAPYDPLSPTTLTIIHSGSIVGGTLDADNDYFNGIVAYMSNAGPPGELRVVSSGDITGVNQGIMAQVDGENANMTLRQDAGLIEAEQIGIFANANESEVRVSTSGRITTGTNLDSKGIYITSSSGGLLSLAQVMQGAAGEIYNQGTDGQTAGIYVENAAVADITVAGKVRSSVGAGIVATEWERTYHNTAPSGDPPNYVFDDSARAVKIDIHSGGAIEGGSQGAGISTLGGNRLDVTIAQGGTLGALSDVALNTEGYDTLPFWYLENANGQWTLHELPSVQVSAARTVLINAGVMTGTFQLESGQDSFTNTPSGIWNLRRFADTDADQVRDTLSVAVARFGIGTDNHIVNQGTIHLLGDEGQATSLDASGEYLTGYAANTMALGGAVQGQILGVQTFSNSGVIDLTSPNRTVGNVLVISGGHTPGVSGGGVFVADGGSIRINTALNEGGANSQSDMLVVDATQLGRAATTIDVTNTHDGATQTVANGIELVRVLDPTQSAAGVFQLNGRLVAGAYEYDLYHGGVDADAGDGNWYLRSMEMSEPGPEPELSPRPETGVYLRNMTLAASLFAHTLHDRLGSGSSANGIDDSDDIPQLWGNLTRNHSKGKTVDRRIAVDTDTVLLHFGSDFYRLDRPSGSRWHFGVMGAYGRSDTDAQSRGIEYTHNGTARTAEGTVEGYSAGVYSTWYGGASSPTDLYVDMWVQYGWYDNTVKGNGLGEESYDSRGWAISIEGGRAFLAFDGEQRQWLIKPQAQLTYNRYRADDHQEDNGTFIHSDDADGILGRMGARLFGRSKQHMFDIQPFVEVNWLYGDAKNALYFDEARLRDGVPKNRYELKIGFQGDLAKGWRLWGHIGAQRGEEDYRRYEGMAGLKKVF